MADTQALGCPFGNGVTWSNGASTDVLAGTGAGGIPSPLQAEVYPCFLLFGPPEITSGLYSDSQVRSNLLLSLLRFCQGFCTGGLAQIAPNLA